ncbi:MAG: ABC transporter ATP-binding protein [Clostridiales bacterium]
MSYSIKHISKSYADILVLNDISFKLGYGEIVGLIGPNGVGKTTTILSMLGFLKIDSGEILFNDKLVKSPNDIALNVSYLPDSPIYYDNLTFKEHLQFTANINKIDSLTFKKKFQELSELLDIADHLDKIPDNLSKGTKQKLMICNSFIRNFSIMIADEPFTALDPKQIKIIKELFIKYKNKNKGILISTHLLDVAQTFCDRYIFLKDGIIVMDETIDSLNHKYGNFSLEEIYLDKVGR